MQSRDGPVLLSILEPRPAAPRPRSSRHKHVYVLAEVAHGVVCWRDGFDSFGLAFADDSRDVLGHMLRDCENAAVADGGIWTEEGYGKSVDVNWLDHSRR